jgi:hypothetical protein
MIGNTAKDMISRVIASALPDTPPAADLLLLLGRS